MARVNIEERCFADSRLRFLAQDMDIPLGYAIGPLTFIWRESQEQLKVRASQREIEKWSTIPPPDCSRFFESLVENKFIEPCEGGLFIIKGNELQIETRISKLKSAHKGGKANKAKWKAIRLSSGYPSGYPGDSSIQCNSVQGNSVQGSADLELLPELDESPSAPPPSAVPYGEVASLWNELAGGKGKIPKLRSTKLGRTRKEKFRVRWEEEPDLDYWRECFTRVGQSPFLRGEVKNFHATFDWIIANDQNHTKVSEGNYQGTSTPSAPPSYQELPLIGDEL